MELVRDIFNELTNTSFGNDLTRDYIIPLLYPTEEQLENIANLSLDCKVVYDIKNDVKGNIKENYMIVYTRGFKTYEALNSCYHHAMAFDYAPNFRPQINDGIFISRVLHRWMSFDIYLNNPQETIEKNTFKRKWFNIMSRTSTCENERNEGQRHIVNLIQRLGRAKEARVRRRQKRGAKSNTVFGGLSS